jgi:hypothetical protein
MAGDGVGVVLSHYQARPMLAALARGVSTLRTSLDLALTQVEVALGRDEVLLANGCSIHKDTLQLICEAEVSCFALHRDKAHKIQAYSEEFGRQYSLMPTESAPTMLVSGLPMHRIKNTNPYKDTQAKMRAAKPRGRVLDICTGLGYTAIAAAQLTGVADVLTIELDPVAQQIAHANPWSRALFDNPKITQMLGDAFDIVEALDDAMFSCVIHDPPMFSLAGHLYAGDFYRALWRVLKPGGCVFHYIGDPNSRTGHRVTRGAVERLKQAGFERVIGAAEAFGVVAFKA